MKAVSPDLTKCTCQAVCCIQYMVVAVVIFVSASSCTWDCFWDTFLNTSPSLLIPTGNSSIEAVA